MPTPHASGDDWPTVLRRPGSVVVAPRATLRAVARRPEWLGAWAVGLALWGAAGAWLLSTEAGRLALVDERVRLIEAFGGNLDDEAYEALVTRPPLDAYLVSGGRVWLLPPSTLATAAVLWSLMRRAAPDATFRQALAVTVHANAVLVLQQLVLAPVHYARESLGSPTTVAALLGLGDETALALWLGGLDVVALWWLWLLAVGAGAATGRPAGRYMGWLAAIYAAAGGVAAMAAAIARGA